MMHCLFHVVNMAEHVSAYRDALKHDETNLCMYY